MSLDNNTLCDSPYTGPNCDVTFAEYLGGSYIAINVIAELAFSLVLIAATYQSVLVTRKSGFTFHSDNTALYFAAICALGGALKGVDPQSWRNIYPFWFTAVLYDISTCATLSICFVVVHSWAQFVFRAVFRSNKATPRRMKLVVIFSLLYAWLSQFISTIFTYTVGPLWECKIIRYSLFSIIFFFWVIGQVTFGYIIHKVLKDAQRRFDHSQDSHSQSNNSSRKESSMSSTTMSVATTSATGSTSLSNKKIRESPSSKRRRQAISRIYRMNGLAIFAEIIAILGLIYSMFSVSSNKYSNFAPNVMPPPTFGALLFEHVFDLVHFIVAAFTVYFFRIQRNATTSAPAAGPTEDSTEPTENSAVEEDVAEDEENNGGAGSFAATETSSSSTSQPASRANSVRKSAAKRKASSKAPASKTNSFAAPPTLSQNSSQAWLPEQK